MVISSKHHLFFKVFISLPRFSSQEGAQILAHLDPLLLHLLNLLSLAQVCPYFSTQAPGTLHCLLQDQILVPQSLRLLCLLDPLNDGCCLHLHPDTILSASLGSISDSCQFLLGFKWLFWDKLNAREPQKEMKGCFISSISLEAFHFQSEIYHKDIALMDAE